MKLHGRININGKNYKSGDDVSWTLVYPFLLIHVVVFGISGFVLAYRGDGPLGALWAHGLVAITSYLYFYLVAFGFDEVKWFLINATLGIVGIYNEIDNILSLFGRSSDDFPYYIHIVPFLYYILYTFLIRQAVIDLFKARDDTKKKNIVEVVYVAVLLLIYTFS